MDICPRQPPIKLAEIPQLREDLPPVSDEEAQARFLANPVASRRMRANYSWNDECHFCWREHWHDIRYEDLIQVFSFDEIVRFWMNGSIMSNAGEHIKKNHQIVWKIQNVLWQYGFHHSYDLLARSLRCLRDLQCDLPGFELRLTCSSAYNEYGPSVHMRGVREGVGPNLLPGQKDLYLDGPLGLLVFYKGVHVLTVGFAVSHWGLLVAQVQLRHKKGNRFLYHLPGGQHYMDWALGILQAAFPEDRMFLVSAKTAVPAIRKSYEDARECKITPEVEARIESFYARRLAGYRRLPQKVSYFRRDFRRLCPRKSVTAAA